MLFVTGCEDARKIAAGYTGEIVDFTSADWSAKSFINQGCMAALYDRLTAGSVLLIQYGRHDMDAADPARYSDPTGEFADYLERFINAARNRQAVPVLLAPALPGGEAWLESCRQLAERLHVECRLLPDSEGGEA